MQLKLVGHELRYETEQIVFLFFPQHENIILESVFGTNSEGNEYVKTTISLDGVVKEHTEVLSKPFNTKRELGNLVKKSAFYAAKKISDLPAPWGILTGIRPVNPVLVMMGNGDDDNAIRRCFKDKYLVSDDKISLALEIAHVEQKYNQKEKNKVSIYIGIPFCPSRCHYCSFISSAINKTKNAVEAYVQALICEISYTAGIIKEMKLEIGSIYIGGGTPTSLSNILLERLLCAVSESFSSESVCEYTIEAGRPDTITGDKLKTMKKYGVTRISINPQTMHDKTLEIIGRSHTTEDFLKAFSLARDFGFNNINSDIIAGLPGENLEMFKSTVDGLLKLTPEGITVHTLYIKRTAWLKNTGFLHAAPEDISDMLSFAYKTFKEDDVFPYYMYKQKTTLGNLENVGYSKKGHECLYNIKTMSDRQSIIALGAGAVSKIIMNNRIERIFNYKNVDDYIKNLDEIIIRKEKLKNFI